MDAGFSAIDRQIERIASLKDPVRRRLYDYVVEQFEDVTRDKAAEGAGVSRALAAFHLDKLVQEGLLQARFKRLTGREGPGAGRPSKLYRRSNQEVSVSLPPRSYELAARLFARALDTGKSEQDLAALRRVSAEFGHALGTEARDMATLGAGCNALLDEAEHVLASYGFEPYRSAEGAIHLKNCPFDALARQYRDLVCGMNLSIMQGVVDGLLVSGIEAVLEPRPDMCCVVFRATESSVEQT
jgi:predicted ArsR family transcriptional regulator